MREPPRYVAKALTEEVNVTPVHPLVNFVRLLGEVAAIALLLYGGLSLVAYQLAMRLDPATEEALGQRLSASLIAQSAPLADSRRAYLQGLLDELASQETAKSYPPVKPYILDSSLENAMVAPGSYLFVTAGLLANVESENELAFILAHELGHLQHRDPLRALGRSLVWLSLNLTLGLAQIQPPAAFTSAANLSELSHSRTQERAADAYAVRLIQARYPHADHALDFFKRAQAQESDFAQVNQLLQWQQSHPLTGDRIANLEAAFVAAGLPLEGEKTPLPEHLACADFRPCD